MQPPIKTGIEPAATGGPSARRQTPVMVWVALGTLAILGAVELGAVVSNANRLREVGIGAASRLGDIQFQSQESRRTILYALTTKDPNLQLPHVDRSRSAGTSVERLVREVRAMPLGSGSWTVLRQFKEAWGRYLLARDQVIALILEDRLDEAHQADLTAASPLFDMAMGHLRGLKVACDHEARIAEDALAGSLRWSFLEIALLVATAFGLLAQRSKERQRSLAALHLVNEDLQAAQANLLQAREQLEGLVSERTRELRGEIEQHQRTQSELLTAMEAAQASSRSKSLFLANMSHELRTPLNAIIGYSEMIEEESADQAIRQDAGRIRRSGRHLLTLINEVLDISKIEAGKMEVSPESVNVREMIDAVIPTVQPLAAKKGNTLLVECGDPGATMMADRIRFEQSLLNLLSNACKFTEQGRITLTVGEDIRAGWLRWDVRDTGIGIPREKMPELFQAFNQVDSSPTRKFEGTGLGLAISQRLCQLMGGEIRVESKPGQGSCFSILIPAGPQDTPTQPSR